MLLRDKDRQTLLQIFSGAAATFEVWAYGSRVNGTAHSGSDLDLVIIPHNRQKLPADLLPKLREEITHSNIPILVEIFDWAGLPESFQRNIEAQHEVLFSNLHAMASEPAAPYHTKKKDSHS